MPPRIQLIGHYGRGNFGDDLMCVALARHLLATTDARLIISAEDSRPFRDLDPSRVSIIARSPRAILGALKDTDLLIQGGGTIFHDSYRGPVLRRYWAVMAAWLGVFAIARLRGARLALVGAGVGPADFALSRVIIGAVLRTCRIVSVRDEASVRTVQRLAPRTPLKSGFDIAALADHRCEFKPGAGITLGLSVCDLAPFIPAELARDYWVNLSEALSRLAETRPLRVVFLSLFNRGTLGDEPTAKTLNIRNASVEYVRYEQSLDDILDPIARCDLVLAARFHAAVAAYLSGRPVIPIAYNRKSVDLADELGLPTHVTIERPLTPDEWVAILEDALREPPAPRVPVDVARLRASRSVDAVLAELGAAR